MIIDWNKYFSHIFVISKTDNFDKRTWLISELSRVGLNNYHWWWNCDNKIISPMSNEFISEELRYKRRQIQQGHYTLIKTCYELGYDNILICEDDICFLKDLNLIKNILDDFENKKSDIYLFDYLHVNKILPNDIRLYSWSPCYYLNRKGMQYIIYCLEASNEFMVDELWFKILESNTINVWANDYQSLYIDNPNILPINLKVSETHLCIQKYETDPPNVYKEIEGIDEKLYNKY